MKRTAVFFGMWLAFGALCAAQTSPATAPSWATWKLDPARMAFFADHGWHFTADPGMKPLRPDGHLASASPRPLELGLVPDSERHTVYTCDGGGYLTVYSLPRLEQLYLRSAANRQQP